jgi:hypothetical protein
VVEKQETARCAVSILLGQVLAAGGKVSLGTGGVPASTLSAALRVQVLRDLRCATPHEVLCEVRARGRRYMSHSGLKTQATPAQKARGRKVGDFALQDREIESITNCDSGTG